LEEVKCNLCGKDDYIKIFDGKDYLHGFSGSFNVVKCRCCGLIYLNPRPSPSEMETYYPDHYVSFDKQHSMAVKKIAQAVTKMKTINLQRIVGAGEKRVLEIGCSDGAFLAALRDLTSWNLKGVEPNKRISEKARKKGFDVKTATIEEITLPVNNFDLVIMNHVIEHVTDPDFALRKIYSILKLNGILYMELPNIDCTERWLFGKYWSGYDVPRHLYSFSAKSLEDIMKKKGFRIKHISYSMDPSSLFLSIRHVLKYKYGLERLSNIFTLNNLLLLFPFAFISFFHKIMKLSGIITVVGKKED